MNSVFYYRNTGIVHSTTNTKSKLSSVLRKQGISVIYTDDVVYKWNSISVKNNKIIGVNQMLFSGVQATTKFINPYRLIEDTKQDIVEYEKKDQLRIGVVRCIGLGDVLMTMQVAIPSLRKQYQDAYITYYTNKIGHRLIYNSKMVDDVKALNWKHTASSIAEVPDHIHKENDIVINLVNRVDFLPVVLKRNRVDNFLFVLNEQIKQQGYNKCRKVFIPHPIYIGNSSINWLYEVFKHNHIAPPIIGCQLSSHGKMKHLGINQWIDLANEMPEYTFIWFTDQSQFSDLDVPNNVINTSAKLNFDEYLTLWSACDVTVSTDSGGAHISGCLNQPCVVLIGSTKYKDHFNNYESTIELQSEDKLECSPCIDWQLRSDCQGESVAWCMKSITTNQIADGINRLL